MIQHYGWIPDKIDLKDIKYTLEKLAPIQRVNLHDNYKLPIIYDQGNLGSCTGNGVAKIIHFDLLNKHSHLVDKFFTPSRLFIYYYERLLEGTVNIDAGAEIRDGIKVANTYGVPSEDLWPYDIAKFNTAPSKEAVDEALQFEAIEYRWIDNTNKQLIVNALLEGYPVVFGFRVFESFESDIVTRTGVVPMPRSGEGILGGHCMVIFGYSVLYDAFIFANSWGTAWGQHGYGRIPAAYLTNPEYASDFWIINTIK